LFLMSDVGGNPSATLFTFTDPTFGSGNQNYAFTPPSPFTVTAGTTYWLVMVGNAATRGTYWFANIPAITPTGTGAISAGGRYSANGFPPISATTAQSYQIDGTPTSAVPAPPTLLLGLVGAGVTGVARLRRRR
jgi:hypothetical protein